jgi:DNA-binding CsgD family transcriptional regulator
VRAVGSDGAEGLERHRRPLPTGSAGQRLIGRDAECEALDRLVADVIGGSTRALVLRGEAGVGKSALLAHLSGRAVGCRVSSVRGMEADVELDYSGLRQVCAPLEGYLTRLPAPQRGALATVFDLASGRVPAPFLVGLATLTLFGEAAEDRPFVCVVDDAQWLDRSSARVLEFVTRRLLAERVGLVCAARDGDGADVLAGLPDLHVRGLDDASARELLMARVHGPVDPAVVARVVAESRGNPLALIELPRTWTPANLAGGFGGLDARPVPDKIEDSYRRRLGRLPAQARLLLLLAAADPVGDPRLMRRAAGYLGLDTAALTPALDEGLLRIGTRVEFAHPLVRSVAYQADVEENRRRVHAALAEATDPGTDPDRRAWHRAQAVTGTDEDVAADLERSADRARGRGGVAAAAAFLRRAVTLTEDPARRARRALAAAVASMEAAAFDQALGLLEVAEAGPLDDVARARAALLRARVAFARGLGRDAPPLLLEAARRFEPLDLEVARETYLLAWAAAVFAGRSPRAGVSEVSRAARALPPASGPPRPLHLLLDGVTILTTQGRAAAAPVLRRAAGVLADIPLDDVLRWGSTATAASDAVWDHEATRTIASTHLRLLREAGALGHVQLSLAALGSAAIWRGDFAEAAAVLAEADDLAQATGSASSPTIALRLSALQGKDGEVFALTARTLEQAASRGQGMAAVLAHWATAVFFNGLARHHQALAAAIQATTEPFEPFASAWALPELVESAVGAGRVGLARAALERLTETTQACGTDFALGIEARSCALVTDGPRAEELYREAVERLGRAGLRPDLGRSHLLLGEWLHRQGRDADARRELRSAHDVFGELGMAGFAERARRDLAEAGGKTRVRARRTARDELTPQEERIARLARDGLSNTEIGAHLFLSARTVEWHLRKVFTKLGISSRRELRGALARRSRSPGGTA